MGGNRKYLIIFAITKFPNHKKSYRTLKIYKRKVENLSINIAY